MSLKNRSKFTLITLFSLAISLVCSNLSSQTVDPSQFEPPTKPAQKYSVQQTQFEQPATQQNTTQRPVQKNSNVLQPRMNNANPNQVNGSLRPNNQLPNRVTQGPLDLTANFILERGTNHGYLVLNAEMSPGSYIYSTTQKGDLNPSVISTIRSNEYRTGPKFRSSIEPKVILNDPLFKQRVEKHTGSVQFFVEFEIKPGLDPNKINPVIVFDGQVCSDDHVCMPINGKEISASFNGYVDRKPTARQAKAVAPGANGNRSEVPTNPRLTNPRLTNAALQPIRTGQSPVAPKRTGQSGQPQSPQQQNK